MAKAAKPTKQAPEDRFEAVAKGLGCDEDKARFEEKLGKLAKAKPKGKWSAPIQLKVGEGYYSKYVPSGYEAVTHSPTFATEEEVMAWVKRQP